MFVDWVSVSQYHGADTPELVGSLSFKNLDDEAPIESSGPKQSRGSHDSSLQVKSHNGWVRVSGNPSRWNRPDNLFGYDLDECMLIINEHLATLGLPAFTVGVPTSADRNERRAVIGLAAIDGETVDGMGDHEAITWSGAAFSRLDLCENFSTGSEFLARLAMRSYQARAVARLKKATYGEETALWHNTRRSVKAYRKGPDMAVHCPDSEWIDWANQNGIVRHECAIKSRFLSATGLRYWGNLNMGTLHRLFERETEVLRRPDASLDPMAVEACPARARLVYAAWLKGEDITCLVSRATLFRHRKTLLETASVDISQPRNVADVAPIVRYIELKSAVIPDGYVLRAA
ncbi:MAG: phage/plasmid replication protein [Pseudomonadota bacterium]|nr:phage/plasmid replication protein [Pseudomonadota bacterium]